MKSLSSTLLLSILLAVPAASQQTAPAPATPPAGANRCQTLRQQALTSKDPAEVLRQLGEAQTVCREALKGFTAEQQPVPWALATLDLGNVTADRAIVGGGAGALQGLDEATELYRQALGALSPERAPDVWAAAQLNLGSALQSRGIRTPGEKGIPYLQEAADRLRQALRMLSREKDPQKWAETQNNLALALAELGTRQGKTAGIAALDEAFRAFGEVQTVYTRELQPRRWSEARLAQARVLLAQEKTEEAYPVLAEILDKTPENRRALLTFASLLAGPLGRPTDAAAQTLKWIERHPEDLEMQLLNMEYLFAAGRLAEARYRSVSLSEKAGALPPAAQIHILGYEVATGLATGAKGAPDRLNVLISLLASQPQDFRLIGNFAGSLRFLQARPDIRNSDWQVRLLHALQGRDGRDAMLAELRKLESEMTSGG